MVGIFEDWMVFVMVAVGGFVLGYFTCYAVFLYFMNKYERMKKDRR